MREELCSFCIVEERPSDRGYLDKTWQDLRKKTHKYPVCDTKLHVAFVMQYHDIKHTALTNGERDGGMEWYKLKKSCRVEESRNAAREKENMSPLSFAVATSRTQHNTLSGSVHGPDNSPQLPDLHEVGICTVQRSSDDSSVDVPIKS